MSNVIQTSSGVGFPGLLTMVFIVMKLTGYIAWSWWWVLSPLWIPAVIGVLILMIMIIVAAFSGK